MARINTHRLIQEATRTAVRVDAVRKDPAVTKAWKEAADDAAQLGKSAARAWAETEAAWRRSG